MNPIEFARNLFLLRRSQHMTIEELAEALEVSVETVCAWECAKTSPSLDQMNRLAKVYGVPLADIIRNPKPMDEIPEPVAEETPLSKETEEPLSEAEEELPAPVPEATPRRGRKKKKVLWWEILVIALLLIIIAAALTFLIKPEWFPLVQFLGK